MTKQQLKLIREASSKKHDSAEDFLNRMEQWLDLKMNPFVRALIKGEVGPHFMGFKFIRTRWKVGTRLKKLKSVEMLLDANES